MPRSPKNKRIMKAMCGRLKILATDYLEMDLNTLSRKLGYSNTTALRKVWNGESFPDTERLLKLKFLKTVNGLYPNIDWLITGEGSPESVKKKRSNVYEKLKELVEKMPESKAKSLLKFLS